MDIIWKYSQIYGSPFLVWVFMWVNAIKDVALFVDWPDCVFYKADMLYKTHDLFSDLKQASIDTKLYFSGVMPNKMVRGYNEDIKRKLSLISENPKFNLWIITCMPVTWLLATQYDNIYYDLIKDFIFIPSYTDKFRIDWYSIFIKELAKYMKIDETKEKKRLNISIVWYLFDRNEWDCIWNIEEIKRILSLIWVEVNTIWLNWWNLRELSNIEDSQLIISLPYWSQASIILWKRLNVDILNLDVPFWLRETIYFLEQIWNKLWIDKNILNSVIKKEISFIKWKIDFLDEKVFLNKNYIYAWDPFLEKWIIDIWNFLWMNHIFTYNYIWSKQLQESDSKTIDLIIWNSESKLWINKHFEFGFPSYNTHFLMDRPYMWFKWLLYFIERLYIKMSNYEN